MKNFVSSHRLFSTLFVLMALLFVVESCVKDNFQFDKMKEGQSWNPSIAVPLVYSTLTVEDILREAEQGKHIRVDADNFITLVYESSLFSITAQDSIKIPNQNILQNIAVDATQATAINGLTLGQTYTITPSTTVTMAFQSGKSTNKIDSVVYKSGGFNITFTSSIPHNGTLNVSIPTAKKNGVAFNENVPFVAGGGNTTKFIDLAGYTFDMSMGGTDKNKFNVTFSISITKSAATASAGNSIVFTGTFADLKFSKFFGLIDLSVLSPSSDTTSVTLFNNAIGLPRVTFAKPLINFNINNSFGVPLTMNVNYFQGFNPEKGTQYFNQSPADLGFPSPLVIASPTRFVGSPSVDEIGQSKKTTISLGNQKAVDFINYQPSQIRYKMDTKTNSSTAIPNTTFFVLDTSKFKVDLHVELPLHGTANGLTFADTMEFALPETEGLESVIIRTYFKNGFPMDVDMQVYLGTLNSNSKIFTPLSEPYGSLFKPAKNIVAAGAIDGNGKVIAQTEKTTDILITRAMLDAWKGATHVLIRGITSTNNTGVGNVKFYFNDALEAKIGIQSKFKVTTKTANQLKKK